MRGIERRLHHVGIGRVHVHTVRARRLHLLLELLLLQSSLAGTGCGLPGHPDIWRQRGAGAQQRGRALPPDSACVQLSEA